MQCLSAPQPCDNPQDTPYQRLTPPKRRGRLKASWAPGQDMQIYLPIAEVVVNGSWKLVGWAAGVVRKAQTGFLYHYALVMLLGIFVLLTVFVFRT